MSQTKYLPQKSQCREKLGKEEFCDRLKLYAANR